MVKYIQTKTEQNAWPREIPSLGPANGIDHTQPGFDLRSYQPLPDNNGMQESESESQG